MPLRILIWSIITIIIPLSGGYSILALTTFDTVVPGVSIDGARLGGKTFAEARAIIEQKAAFFEYGKMKLTGTANTWEVTPHDIGVVFDIDTTTEQAYAIGRGPNIIQNIFERASAIASGNTISFVTNIDEKQFTKYVEVTFGNLGYPAIDASLHFDPALNNFIATEARAGVVVNASKLKYDILSSALRSSERIAVLSMQNDEPLITAPMLENVVSQANTIIEHSPITLLYGSPSDEGAAHRNKKTYSITKEQLKDILTVTYRDTVAHIDTRPEAIHNLLVQIAPSININPQNAILTVKNGKAKEFAISKNGINLDIEKSAEHIRDGILAMNTRIDLVATEALPEIRTETIENLGLIALLGKGESDFSGSPASRVFNVKLGAEKLNGVLIKPGEEFSFMNTIGDVGAKEGYQFALVIKNGGELVREYGGGLCQVSTTMFRAAIYSGLTVTERYPHSLPVSYYNPQGFDAAVYSPHPDLRFKNDTPSNILVQTKIVGSKLYFEFYGTPDGRETKVIGPVEYDKKPDGSLKAKLTQEIYKDDTLIAKNVFASSYRSPKKEAVQKNPLE